MILNKAFWFMFIQKETCKTNETYILQQLKKLKKLKVLTSLTLLLTFFKNKLHDCTSYHLLHPAIHNRNKFCILDWLPDKHE